MSDLETAKYVDRITIRLREAPAPPEEKKTAAPSPAVTLRFSFVAPLRGLWSLLFRKSAATFSGQTLASEDSV